MYSYNPVICHQQQTNSNSHSGATSCREDFEFCDKSAWIAIFEEEEK